MLPLNTPIASVLWTLGLMAPLAAQNFERSLGDSPQSGDQPRVLVEPIDAAPVLDKQDSLTLERRSVRTLPVSAVVDLSVLRNASPFREVASGRVGEVDSEGVKQDLDRVSAAYRELGRAESDCNQVRLSVETHIKQDPTRFLETLETEISVNPSCACEIVKSTIKVMESDVEEVVSIVDVAIHAAPGMMRMISQCAIASSPESLTEVQELLARYDTNAGEAGVDAKSAKSAKDAKAAIGPATDDVAAVPNPLDFPGAGPVGPTPGGPGGTPLFPPNTPVIVTPPSVTIVDP